jgi:hypothetical protein
MFIAIHMMNPIDLSLKMIFVIKLPKAPNTMHAGKNILKNAAQSILLKAILTS